MSSPKYPLSRVLECMKPCKPDTDKPSHMVKLNAALDGDDYIAEEKFDGCRYLYIGGRFFSTHIQVEDGISTGFPVEKSAQLWPIVEQLQKFSNTKLILDGEIVFPGGKAQDVVSVVGCLPSEAVQRQKETPLTYMVFDILRDPEGGQLLNTTWGERRFLLESLKLDECLMQTEVRVVQVAYDQKRQLLDEMLATGHEGLVLKRITGRYYPGKRPMWEWIKCKAQDEDDVVIMGFEPPVREYTGKDPEFWPYKEDGEPVTKLYARGWIGAIVFGKCDGSGNLVRLGTCSGMDEATRAAFSYSGKDHWEGTVMKIQFMEKTRDGAYRHPRFIMIHPDKNARECVL